MDAVIRRMEEKDLNLVIQLGEIASEFKTGTETSQFYSYETLARWIRSRNGVLLVAEVETRFAGFIIVGYNSDSRDAYIHCLLVVEELRGQGIGDQLVEEVTCSLVGLGCNHIFLLTSIENTKATEFFIKHGFSVGGLFRYLDKTLPKPS